MRLHFSNILKFRLGLILLSLNTGIWIYCFFINRPYALSIVTALPLLYVGALLLLNWYKGRGLSRPSKSENRRFFLRVLGINYGILYLICVVQDVVYGDAIDLLSLPGIILPFLMGVYIMGLILSWNRELYPGIFFLLWYFVLLYGSFKYHEILNRGPYILFGIVVLVNGILFLTYDFKIKHGKY